MSKDFFARIRERIKMHVEGKRVTEEELLKKEKAVAKKEKAVAKKRATAKSEVLDNKPNKR